MNRIVFAAIAATGLFAAACSTPPEPVVIDTAPPVVDDTPPVVDEGPQGPMPGSPEDFEVNAGDRVFFDLDRSTLTNSARATLRSQAAWLSAYPNVRVLIAGNADERGTREYNLALGARRAAAVRDFLVSQGVDPARISTVSYGKERPVCRQSTERCWALNRNGTTVLQSGMAS
ncbi:peptidoglycan-associated lipoprotein Pal [Maricaulaceae bacterium NA33B04]|nr:peptidoglycan-associated lipoprotein Pal [Maricaulaceae bacterium NA33B04]